MNTLEKITEYQIDLEFVPIGVWLIIKGNLPINTKSLLVKYKDVGYDRHKALETGIKQLLEN